MQKQIKIKTLLIVLTALLLPMATSAEAQAPKMSVKAFNMHLALQEPKQYALQKMETYGWDKSQFVCLSKLWGKESAWNHKADNPTSSAYGIAQMLGEKNKHPMLQINNGLRYIEHRYGEPCRAWKFWRVNRWY